MVRVSNIRVPSHLANFRCDACSTEQTDVNVNTGLSYVDFGGAHVSIRVPCTGCAEVSFYPVNGGGPLSQQLAEAKTA